MTPDQATKLIGLPSDATPDQLEARFFELRRKLEDKIAKAPTPGLQAKYRESLTEITTAFETLTLAADSSALPVLKKETGGGRPETGAGAPSLPSAALAKDGPREPRSQSPALKPPARKSGGREFALVAIIAIAVLGAGGWFILKTRAENAEKARIAAEAKAEAEEARFAAEARRKAEEEEKARVAAAAQAEQERLDKLTGQLRSRLAEYKVAWEVMEREERNAEKQLAELKSDLRSLRNPEPADLAEAQAEVAAQHAYLNWLSGTMVRHPARVARSKAEELISARQPDEALAAVEELKTALADLEALIPKKQAELLTIRGNLMVLTAGDAKWSITDVYGRTRTGEGSARVDGLAVGEARVRFHKAYWPDREEEVQIRGDRSAEVNAAYVSHEVDIASTPSGAEVIDASGAAIGKTPLRIGFPPGKWAATLRLDGYYSQNLELSLPLVGASPETVILREKPKGLVKPARWSSPARVRIDTRSVMSGTSNSNTQTVEEWDLSKPDGQGGWQENVRKLTSRTGVDRTSTPVDGSVMRQQRQPDGKWTGEFTQGGLRDGTYNYIWTSMVPNLWLVSLGGMDIWPETAVAVGGTWSVKPGVFFSMIGFQNAAGNVTGKVLSLDQEGDDERAVIEFSYNYNFSGMTGQDTMKLHLNLTECYVTRAEGRGSLQHSVGHISTSYTITVTKR